MGLLDAIIGNGSGGGGLLDFLKSPLYTPPIPKDDFSSQLATNPYEGLAIPPPSTNIWDQPGIKYSAAPPLSAFNTGAAPIYANPMAPSPTPAAAPMSAAPQPQAPMADTAGSQPQAANAMNIGGYQMPRIGSADQFQAQQMAIPPNAQPTQGQMASAQPQFSSNDLPPALGGGGYFNRLKSGGSLIGSLLGDSVQQQNLSAQFQATYGALRANGVPDAQAKSTALLAAMNPEAAKTVLPELLTNKEKYQVISEDPLTGKQYGFVNDREQTVNGKTIGQQGSASGQSTGLQAMTDKITQMRTQGATRDQMLNLIPTGYRDDVASLLSGKAVPANMGRAQSRMALLTLAKTVDPNFNETDIPGRVKMRSDFMGEGKNGQAIGSFNTAQHHIDKLSDDLETVAKFQGNYPTINAIRSAAASNLNSNPELRDALQSLNTDMAAVSHEVGNAYNAGHLSDHDMATWNALTNSNLPPDQLRRGMADFVDLLNGKRDSLNHMYRQQFGEDAPSIETEKNAAVTAKVHQRSPQYGGASSTGGLPSGWSVRVR